MPRSIVIALVTLSVACGGPPPKMTAAKQDDGVAANSASEERLKGEPKPTTAPVREDPSQPHMTPVNPAKEAVAPAKNGKVSKAECKALFDKYIDLTIATDSRFAGIPPEMLAGLKAQAQAQAEGQKGDPCSKEEVTRAQYTCAIAATSTAAWQRCMK